MAGPVSDDGKWQWDGKAWQPIPPPPGQVAATSGDRGASNVLIVSAALIVVGILLPWETATMPGIGSRSSSPIQGPDGWIVVVALAVVAGLALRIRAGKTGILTLVGLAALFLLVGWTVVTDYQGAADFVRSSAGGVVYSYGVGGLVAFFGMVSLLVGLILAGVAFRSHQAGAALVDDRGAGPIDPG